jgi:dCTP deaminase
LGNKYKIFTNLMPGIIDPKADNQHLFHNYEGDHCIIPPHSYVLAESLEYLEIPRDIIVVCVGKSTYARCGIIANVTPLECSWVGKVTIEISNNTPLPTKIYSGEGILQLLFFRGEVPCRSSYEEKGGKYQNQLGLTLPKVD